MILLADPVHADNRHSFTFPLGKNITQESESNPVITTLEVSRKFIGDTPYLQVEHTPDMKKEKEALTETYIVTAYTAGVESTGKSPDHPAYGITASGNLVKQHETLACPNSLDFGTQVYIPKLDETFTCEDRGSAITEGRLDVYIEDLEEAIHFGVQELEVQILEEKKNRQFVFR
ncbi:3D domain-containing protein [Oceanobacillus kapialis]|uniref:3D domain-containing protein n=1 Tax=Oceanobacillus kapialis TaxID=481353 RepID=UPI00384D09F6